MNRKHFNLQFIVLILLFTGANLFSQDTPKSPKPNPNIDGTYRLVSRMMPDSSTVSPPDVVGMATFANGHRQTIIAWRDQNGLIFSSSIIAKYTLTDSLYSETILYGSTHNEIAGQPIKYNFEAQSGSSPVKREGAAKITFKLPLGAPTLTFDGETLTSTVEKVSVDTWERVK